jgi:hypothetical protein
MEVHHHAHTARKKWTHYFWEFIMLFLAVFCGFLAELQLEHRLEHTREKQYMTTLLEDLKRDTLHLNRLKGFFNAIVERRDSITRYLKPPVQKVNIVQYYREVQFITTMVSYAYNDRTVEQLRQSGNYRLIRKINITDSLTKYDNWMRNTFAKNYTVLWENRIKLNNDLNAIIDNASYEYVDGTTGLVSEDSLRKKNLWPLRLLTNDVKTLTDFYNAALLQRSYMFDFIQWIKRMKMTAENLILLIQKEYHLK